jgi:hypothetical protein
VALFEPIFSALNAGGGRYVVVGGLATVLHGHARLTADVDLMVDLTPSSARATIEALTDLGFRPRPPVPALAFADPAARAEWVTKKGMRVFSLWDPADPMREIDLFIEHPIPFEDVWARSVEARLESTTVRIASIEDLIALKRLANRPQDIQDIEALEKIRERREARGK